MFQYSLNMMSPTFNFPALLHRSERGVPQNLNCSNIEFANFGLITKRAIPLPTVTFLYFGSMAEITA